MPSESRRCPNDWIQLIGSNCQSNIRTFTLSYQLDHSSLELGRIPW